MEMPLRKEEAKAYLEEKYHESFELYSSLTVGLNQPYCELFFQSASHPEATVKVYDDYQTFSDNYFGVLVHDQVQKMIDGAAEGIPCEMKAFFRFQAGSFPGAYSDAASFPQYLAADPSCFTVNMFLFSDAANPYEEAVWDTLCGHLREEHITGNLNVYLLDRNDYLAITADTFDEYLSKHYSLQAAYSAYIR